MVQTSPTPAPDQGTPQHRKAENFDLVQAVRTAVRTSPWVTIAVGAHILVAAVLSIMSFAHASKKEEVTSVISANIAERQVEVEQPPEEIPEVIDRKAIPENREAELVDPDVAVFTITDSMVEQEDLTLDVGNPDSIDGLPGTTGGTAIGIGTAGHKGTGVPSAFGGRLVGGGGPKGRASGDVEKTEAAVRAGLIWLARHQEASGEWNNATYASLCPPEAPCQPETTLDYRILPNHEVGLTSLALLTYLGAGYGHDAKQFVVDTVNAKKIYIGKDIVKKGLQWLKERQQPDGSFSERNFFLYNEALAALALSEAYGLTHSKYWKEPAQKAIDFICQAQKPHPTEPDQLWGWRYFPADVIREGTQFAQEELSEADMSVTGWMVMALKSAEISGLKVPQKSIDGALAFSKWCTGRNGEVGYRGPEFAGQPVTGEHDNYAYHIGSMSSIGMCVRIFLEGDLKDPFLFEAADILVNDLPRIGEDEAFPEIDYYYWYYGSLALNQIDGPDAPRRTDKYWGPWNKAMQDTLLGLQNTTKRTCATGGWMKPDRWAYGVGPIYTTAMNVLTLEVYYRYANAFGLKESKKPKATEQDDVKATPVEDDETDQK